MISRLVFSHPDFEKDLFQECENAGATLERVAKGLYSVREKSVQHNASFVWARDDWKSEIITFDSVAKAADELRARSKLPWTHVTTSSHRRGELIELTFGSKAKIAKLHAKKTAWPDDEARLRIRPAFTLLTPNEMAVCVSPSEEVAGGDWIFDEDRDGPPSRAYLKLWEWGWRTMRLPRPGETALDLGASPGGWTWVLAKAGLNVHAYDRSPLDLKLSKSISSRIHFSKADAFQVTPASAPRADWVFCDVIAEPKRTAALIEAWLPSKAGLVFTVKFKGQTDFAVISRLGKIPGARIRHLNVNKHEVTFWRPPLD